MSDTDNNFVIRKAPKGGGAVSTLADSTPNAPLVGWCGVALTDSQVFWPGVSDTGHSRLNRVAKNNPDPTSWDAPYDIPGSGIDPGGRIRAVTIYDGTAYWGGFDEQGAAVIWSGSLTGVDPRIVSKQIRLHSVLADDDFLYWRVSDARDDNGVTQGGGAMMRSTPAGNEKTVLIDDIEAGGGFAVWDGQVFLGIRSTLVTLRGD